MPLTAKHPVAILIPLADDEVADEVTLRSAVWMPPVKVVVADEVKVFVPENVLLSDNKVEDAVVSVELIVKFGYVPVIVVAPP